MFNDKYGLTDAVLQGRKTMTRRIVPEKESRRLESFFDSDDWSYAKQTCIDYCARYKIGEVVAIAQAYKSIPTFDDQRFIYITPKHKGWTNKMFVRPELMPHQIRITDVKIERLQDISDEDCLKEGVRKNQNNCSVVYHSKYNDGVYHYPTAKDAFVALIDAISGKGTWELNPYVFAYSFVLVK